MNNRAKRFLILLFFACLPLLADVKVPVLRFLNDSVMIGQPIQVALVYQHVPGQEVLFPDSMHNYAPFEFVRKQFTPTRSDSSLSTDSVVYTLITFELARTLYLQLPVFIFSEGDTNRLYSEVATVQLKEAIVPGTKVDSLHVNTQLAVMDRLFNYPYVLIGGGISIVLLLVLLVFFRKRIYNAYLFYFMKKDFKSFTKKYTELAAVFNQTPSTGILEDMLSVWKKYLQKLEKTPYTTLTTKEISALLNINQLTSSLQNFDRAIYGGMIQEDLQSAISYLHDCARLKFNEKTQSLQKHGTRD